MAKSVKLTMLTGSDTGISKFSENLAIIHINSDISIPNKASAGQETVDESH